MVHPLLAELLPTLTKEGRNRTATADIFAKSTATTSLANLRAEAASLAAMARTAPALVPRIVGYRERDGEAALITSYASGGRGDMRELGRMLAEMHAPPKGTVGGKEQAEGEKTEVLDPEYTGEFGFPFPTFCGNTNQDNTWNPSWEAFFRDQRLGDLVRRLGDRRVSSAWDRMLERAVPLLLSNIDPPPVAVPLHGDLWPGNVASDGEKPVIYDAASYYGHGEADLGMTRMFGGFSRAFYDAYHEIRPRSSPHYDERIRLYELYHHLNHALLFGGSYTTSALGIMRELADWAESVKD